MLKRITKAVFALTVSFFSVVFILVTTLGIWLSTGPKDLDKILPFVAEQLNMPASPYYVEMAKVVASWEELTSPIEMQLHDVVVYDKKSSARLVELDQVAFSFSFPKLFALQYMPETMILRKPSLRVYQDEQHQFHLGIGEEKLPLSFEEITSQEKGGSPFLSGLRYIAVQNATLRWGEEGEASSFAVEKLYLRLKKDGQKVFAIFRGNVNHISGDKAKVSGNAEHHKKNGTIVSVDFDDVNPQWFEWGWKEKYPHIAVDAILKGKAKGRFTPEWQPEEVQFQLQAAKDGMFHDAEHFAEPLNFSTLSLSGEMQGMADALTLDNMEVNFHGAELQASGHFAKEEESFTALVNAEAKNMPVNDLYKYWPKTIAPTAYHWVTEHIREGKGRATLRFEQKKEDIGKPLPKDALQVAIYGEGVQVAYLEGHPKAKDVAGEVLFDTQSMTIRSEKGKMLQNSHLKRAYLVIPDLFAVSPPMHIELEVDALAADVVEYLETPSLNYAEPLKLDKTAITGRMQGHMLFDFRLPDEDLTTPYDPDLRFIINAELQKLAQQGFMGKKNVTDGTGKLSISESELTYSGLLQLENSPLTVDLKHSFVKGNPLPTRYSAKGKLDVSLLPAFGVPALPFLNGVADVNAEVEEGEKSIRFKTEADINAVSIWWPEWGLRKNLGEKGSLTVQGEVSDKVEISRFSVKSDPVQLDASGSFSGDFSRIHALNIPKIAFANHDFSMYVQEKSPRYYQVKASGAAFDMTAIGGDKQPKEQFGPRQKQDKNAGFAEGIDVNAVFDRVIFAPEREITAFEVKAQCPAMVCEYFNTAGTYGQKQHFGGEITRNDKGVRQLVFDAQNAGSFLRTLNVYDSMQGGHLRVGGTFDDTKENRPFNGSVRISEHTIVKAPTLAKMATLLSLSGIGDALAGKGITFKKLDMDISYESGLIKIHRGKIFGPALGITMEDGVVDIENERMRMKGTVIPSYTLNSVLGKIPLIGEALAGGRGEGVFAATYTVEGAYPDGMDVTVNPLSMLAPGFVRSIFGGVADTVAPQEKTPKEKELEKEAKQKVEEERRQGKGQDELIKEPENRDMEQQ